MAVTQSLERSPVCVGNSRNISSNQAQPTFYKHYYVYKSNEKSRPAMVKTTVNARQQQITNLTNADGFVEGSSKSASRRMTTNAFIRKQRRALDLWRSVNRLKRSQTLAKLSSSWMVMNSSQKILRSVSYIYNPHGCGHQTIWFCQAPIWVVFEHNLNLLQVCSSCLLPYPRSAWDS